MKKLLFTLWVLLLAVLAASQNPPALTRGQADQRYLRSVSTPLDALLRALGMGEILPYEEPAPPLGVLEDIGQNATGWGTPVGVRGPFNSVTFGLSNQDASFPVTGVRLWIYEVDTTGTVLADVRQPVYVPPGGTGDVTVRLPREIRSSQPLYIRFNTNGRTGVFRTNPSAAFPIGSGWPQYGLSSNTSLDSVQFTKPGGGTQKNGWYRFELRPFERSSTSGDLVTTAEALVSTATFTGYGTYAGSPTHAFNSVELGLSWFRADTRATSFRVVLRRTNSSGAILGEATVRDIDWSGVPALRPLVIRFDLGKDVDPGATWIEVLGDGTFSFSKLLNGTYSTALGTTRYTTSSSLRSPTWSNSGTQWNLWAKFTRWYTSDAGTGIGESELRGSVARAILLATAPRVNLPAQVYATVGKEFSLYFDQCIVPTSGRRAEDLYDIDVVCSIGRHQAERYVIDAGAAPTPGTYALTIDVWDRGVKVASGSTSLIVKAAAVGAGITRKILWGGDSLGEQGHILAELKRLFAADGSLAATFIGSRSSTVADSTGSSQTIAHEAYSGRTAQFLATDATVGTGSKFVLDGGGTFSFSAWLTARGTTMSAGDWFILEFGTNEVFSATSDAGVRSAFWTYRTHVDNMVTNARAAVSGLRVLLITPPGPSGSQDAFGNASQYNAGQTRWRYKRNAALFAELVREWYDSAANRTAGLFVAMPGHGWDTTNNSRRAGSAAMNEYSPISSQRQSDGLHPGGYNDGGGAFQIASHLYQFFKGQES